MVQMVKNKQKHHLKCVYQCWDFLFFDEKNIFLLKINMLVMYPDGIQLIYLLIKHSFLLHLSCGDGFCSPWPAIHILIQSDWLPPDAKSRKLDLFHFCFYWVGGHKRLRGGKKNPLINWLTLHVMRWVQTSSAGSRQDGKFTARKPASPSAFAHKGRCTQQELHVSSEGACRGWGGAARLWIPGMVCGLKSMSWATCSSS